MLKHHQHKTKQQFHIPWTQTLNKQFQNKVFGGNYEAQFSLFDSVGSYSHAGPAPGHLASKEMIWGQVMARRVLVQVLHCLVLSLHLLKLSCEYHSLLLTFDFPYMLSQFPLVKYQHHPVVVPVRQQTIIKQSMDIKLANSNLQFRALVIIQDKRKIYVNLIIFQQQKKHR